MTFVTLIAVAGMGIVLAQIQHGAGRHSKCCPRHLTRNIDPSTGGVSGLDISPID